MASLVAASVRLGVQLNRRSEYVREVISRQKVLVSLNNLAV